MVSNFLGWGVAEMGWYVRGVPKVNGYIGSCCTAREAP